MTGAPILPGGAVVVRFGETPWEAFRRSVRTEARRREKEGLPVIYGLSVVSASGMNAEQLALSTREWPETEGRGLPHTTIRESTVAAVRALGYDVMPDEPPQNHALVVFDQEPTWEDCDRLLHAFGPQRENPVLKGEAKENPDVP